MLLSLAVALLLVVYLWLLHRAGGGGAGAATDRAALLNRAAEALFVVALARIVVPWGELTRWLWVLAAALLASGVARAALRARDVPAADPAAKPVTRAFKRAGAPLYALALLALSVLLLAPLT